MYCPQCGMKVADGTKYCAECGFLLPLTPNLQTTSPMSTRMGVTCHKPGCMNPVSGQCPGYKGSCLRFYCAEHAIEPYCSICVEQAAHDVAVTAIYRDYLDAAQKVAKIRALPGCLGDILEYIAIMGAILAFIGGGYGVTQIWQQDIGLLMRLLASAILILVAFGVLWFFQAIYDHIRSMTPKAQEREIRIVEDSRPGFREFYTEYLRQRNAADVQKILTALLVAGAAVTAIQDFQFHQDVRQVVNQMKQRV